MTFQNQYIERLLCAIWAKGEEQHYYYYYFQVSIYVEVTASAIDDVEGGRGGLEFSFLFFDQLLSKRGLKVLHVSAADLAAFTFPVKKPPSVEQRT